MARPTLAVWKFASCDGCQLTLLDCEDELLALAEAVEISHFLEASSSLGRGPWDISLVEGSVTTEHDAERIREIRAQSRLLVTIGACATAGGIQSLRNTLSEPALRAAVYPNPAFISALATSTPIADHVPVDLALHGCPIDKRQLLATLSALLVGRKPHLPRHAQCVECKQHGTPCVMVAQGTPCLGPVTRAGCGNLCPAHGRGCYGCFGPAPGTNAAALAARFAAMGLAPAAIRDLFASFNAAAPAFAEEARRHG